MIRQVTTIQSIAEAHDVSIAGGKAVNLGRLVRGGFDVPGGFVVTTHAHAAARDASPDAARLAVPDALARDICAAYRQIGGGSVAVRSSATAEDLRAASMAGQYESFLDVNGEDELIEAIRKCWASLDSPRTRAYLRENGIDPAGVAMAVVVQRLVPADVAGVLFTSNQHPGRHHELLIEASWGLGEMVVSGRVQPDVLRLDEATGRVVEAVIADKPLQLTAGASEAREVDASRRRRACLGSRDVHQLWQLGRSIASHFGAPQDVEWAIRDGRVHVLQSRPITTRHDAEAYEAVLRETRQKLRSESAAGRGPWVVHNLAETLPHPTPLTWSVVAPFMTGAGGFGKMYRDAGFAPSPIADREGFLELIAGQIYMDAARAPEMFFEAFPFRYDIDELRRNPGASQLPPTLPAGSALDRLRVGRKLAAVGRRLKLLSETLDRTLRDDLFPRIAGYVAQEKRRDLTSLSAAELFELWRDRERRVMSEFAPGTLLPSLVCGMALGELEQLIAEELWDADAAALAQQFSAGGPPSRTLLADAELFEVGRGERSLEAWLADHGHRATGEFDLSSPRWREQPDAARAMAARLAEGASPLARHDENRQKLDREIGAVGAKLSAWERAELHARVDRVRRYVAFREDGKDFFMLGYDLLRDVAVEAGRRLEIGADAFFLPAEELFDALRVGFAPLHRIEQLKSAHRAQARLTLPRLIDADAIATLGQPPAVPTAGEGTHRALAVSSGVATGPARVLESPDAIGDDAGRGYILVCPSTDPSWTPLFINAAGLIIERGGALSHGAVVARELGLPAVVLPGAVTLFKDGQMIRVDGTHGSAGPADTAAIATPDDADDAPLAATLLPPPPGEAERRSARLSRWAAALWAVYLLACFLLPPRFVERPSLRVLDFFLWPIVRLAGKPATVAIVAVAIAVGTLLIQKWLTDNRRLLEAKRRAATLKASAEKLPSGSPRRQAMQRAANAVNGRTFVAGMVPICLLLGPLVLPFVWFRARVDPASWNPPAGSAVQVVAMVDSAWAKPITIQLPDAVSLDDATPASVTVPPVRATLERLHALYRRPVAADPTLPWELQAAPDLARQQTADDLQAYLNEGVPPVGNTWTVRPPEKMSGSFPIRVTSEGVAPLVIDAVIGERDPPGDPSVTGPSGSPLREVRLSYANAKVQRAFWKPFGALGGEGGGAVANRLAAIDVGWFWLYLIVYLPVLFLARRLLRVA